jgi:hypothetical protein
MISEVFLWLDKWHPDGILYENNGHSIIYDSASKVDAKVASMIKGQSWCWPPASSEELVHIQSHLSLVNIVAKDQPVWSISRRGVYNLTETWETI